MVCFGDPRCRSKKWPAFIKFCSLCLNHLLPAFASNEPNPRDQVERDPGKGRGSCCCQIDVDSLAADSVLEEVEKETEYFLFGKLVVVNALIAISDVIL